MLQDEPENDLDVDTLRALEDAVNSFAGCSIPPHPQPCILESSSGHSAGYSNLSMVSVSKLRDGHHHFTRPLVS